MKNINYEPFTRNTSSSEDLWIFSQDYDKPASREALKNLLNHYDKDIRKEARKLKSLKRDIAIRRVQRYYQRTGELV